MEIDHQLALSPDDLSLSYLAVISRARSKRLPAECGGWVAPKRYLRGPSMGPPPWRGLSVRDPPHRKPMKLPNLRPLLTVLQATHLPAINDRAIAPPESSTYRRTEPEPTENRTHGAAYRPEKRLSSL